MQRVGVVSASLHVAARHRLGWACLMHKGRVSSEEQRIKPDLRGDMTDRGAWRLRWRGVVAVEVAGGKLYAQGQA
jgi:hypothetical protein